MCCRAAEYQRTFRVDQGVMYYADPACRRPGEVYANVNGARGAYFRDRNGHLMEILTPSSSHP